MDNATVRNKTVSTRVTSDIQQKAQAYLAKQGLTISEYLRLSLVKAANNEVKMISFLDTPAAYEAKKEAEAGQARLIGGLDDFDKWVDAIADEN